MPRQCAVFQCNAAASRDVKLLRFPLHDENRLESWVKVANRGDSWKPTQYSRICSKHFPKLQFDSKKRLLSDPVEISVYKPTVSPKTVNLTFSRVPLSLTENSAVINGGGIAVGVGSTHQWKNMNLTEVKSCSTQTTTRTSNKLLTRYKKVKEDKRLLRLKIKAMRQQLTNKDQRINSLNMQWNRLWKKLDTCSILKSLVMRLLHPTKKVNNQLAGSSAAPPATYTRF